jgi:hypothetical protein
VRCRVEESCLGCRGGRIICWLHGGKELHYVQIAMVEESCTYVLVAEVEESCVDCRGGRIM